MKEQNMFDKIFSLLIFLLVLLGFAAAGILKGRDLYEQSQYAKDWPKTLGKITHSEVVSSQVKTGTGSNRRTETFYKADIRYTYTIKGKEYTGNRVFFGDDMSSANSSDAHDLVQKYPVGKKLMVYYESFTPTLTVLEPGTNGRAFLFMAGGAFFLILALLVVVNNFNTRPELA